MAKPTFPEHVHPVLRRLFVDVVGPALTGRRGREHDSVCQVAQQIDEPAGHLFGQVFGNLHADGEIEPLRDGEVILLEIGLENPQSNRAAAGKSGVGVLQAADLATPSSQVLEESTRATADVDHGPSSRLDVGNNRLRDHRSASRGGSIYFYPE